MEDNLQSTVADAPDLPEVQADPQASELVELRQQNGELQDRLLRLQAEFDNFRKRTDREKLEFSEYAGEMTVRALLPALDDFDRALKASAGSASGDGGDELVRGIDLVYKSLMDTLKKLGLEPIIAEGAPFDPHQHQAIGRVESADHEDGTVLQEYQRGYRFKGRLLRPTMVQVAVRQ